MAASASTQARGFLLIGVYTAGFVLPFLAVGMFSTTLLDVFKRHGNVVTYAARAGAVLMILMGVMMFTGKMNSITGYLSSPQTGAGTVGKEQEKAGETADPGAAGETAGGTGKPGDGPETGETASETGGPEAGETLESAGETVTAEGPEETAGEGSGAGADTLPSVDFTLTDQFGNSHTLSDYKGKTVFLNFWATWCPPCRREMPDIQKLYEKYQAEEDPEVVILGVAAPDYGDEGSREEIAQFLEENGYTYPVVMDEGGELFMTYGVFSYPTTFMIDRDGNVFGYAAGQLSMEMMESIIRQTVTGVREQPGQ
jgi:cytochrome c-type biogenesis protein